MTPSTAPNLVITLMAETASYDREAWLARHPDPMLVAIRWRETAWAGVGSTADARARPSSDPASLESDAPVWRVRRRESSDMESITIGRSPRCDVIIPEPGISKLHAYVQRQENGWSFSDAESRNGSMLDDVAVEPMIGAPLRSGMKVQLGANAQFLFLEPADLWDRLVIDS